MTALFDVAAFDVIWLSVRVAAVAVATTLVPAIATGWLLARWNHPARAFVQGAVMLPLVLPPVVTGYLLLIVLGRSRPLGMLWNTLTGGHIAYTTGACVIAAAVVGFPLMVEAIRLAIAAVDPRLEQVSRSLGRGRFDTFLRVTVPLAAPGILAGAVLAWARALGEFGATIVLAGNIAGQTRTIPLAVYTLLNARDGEAGVVVLIGISVTFSMAALLMSFRLSARDAQGRPIRARSKTQ